MSLLKDARDTTFRSHSQGLITDEKLLLLLEENTSRNPHFFYHAYIIAYIKPKGQNEIELLPYIYAPCLQSVNFTVKICITVQIDLLGLQDLLRIVRKIPAFFTIMFISGSKHFHLGDLSVLKEHVQRDQDFRQTGC